ncbi:TonB-dependent receptor [Saccharobesus litoralis]|uniref:TonB-dependent receptor n=1 Tax=Saccharobesus litoralis TaxID=2172099 RepID=A0A2S0VN82_9ALTE|nr:TonB-dependent receptor [Saccharobesus litoralis]AWB65677.1 TonB-dependent receptor [Saccharobesus litoralis]
MSNTRERFKLSALSLAILASSASMVAYAAEDDKKDKEEDTEVIEVTGFRGSILKSINEKRNSATIVDSIFAEDIGKTTDQNIADALSRVTGVSIQTDDGEGTKISVRGAQSDFNNISLNGVSLTSSDENNSVDLSAFSADVLSQINVYKTSSADHDEGSLGANVVLKTARPLDLKNDRANITVQGRYNEYADKYDNKISGSFSKKFFDETFGVIFTAANETQAIRRDEVGSSRNSPYQVLDLYQRWNVDGSEEPVARDMDGNLIYGGDRVLVKNDLTYSLKQNQRDRHTLTSGFQFAPNDSTNIQLDLSYSYQQIIRDDHRIRTNMPNIFNGKVDEINLTQGQIFNKDDVVTVVPVPGWGQNRPPQLDENGEVIYFPTQADPQEDWWTVDTEMRTLVKSLNRFQQGQLNRSQEQNETTNKVATLTLEQWLTDSLYLEVKAGYSQTEFDVIDNSSVSSATWQMLHRDELKDVPLDELQPVGIDCTTGDCQMVVGEGSFVRTPGGSQRGRPTTTFIPTDPYAQHLGGLSLNDGYTLDTNKSLYVDLDWDVDFAGITKFETGFKISQRDKDVHRQNGRFDDKTATVFDPVTQRPITSTKLSTFTINEVMDVNQSFPYDDWMDGLVAKDSKYSLGFVENGWPLIDARKAFSAVFSLPDYRLVTDDSQSRQTIQDNYSLYAKLNFEFLDGRLTGDLGTRFVHTEIQAKKGKSAINFYSGDGIFDPVSMVERGLFTNPDIDPNMPECPNVYDVQTQSMLIDGTGIVPDEHTITDIRTGEIYSAGQTVPNQYPCYDPRVGERSVNVNGQNQIEYINYDQANSNRGWWWGFRHADNSTALDKEKYLRTYDSEGEGESDIWLPSLNLNYQLTDNLITRFAASKTMSRPVFDDLRPGFRLNENVWGLSQSNMTAPNPKLKPLQSKNLDLSFEWYFNKEGQLSLAFFKKDMSDFPENVRELFYYRDMRTAYDTTELTYEDLLISHDETLSADAPIVNDKYSAEDNVYCMPNRYVKGQITSPMHLGCDEVVVEFKVNGASTRSKGLEFGYRQTYDFLPGVLSGLGMDFNYTYAKTESDPTYLEITDSYLDGVPQKFTPKHSANTSLYWQKAGNSMRLTHRYSGIQFVDRLEAGRLWLDEKSQLDFAFNYKVNNRISLSFNALNLTNVDNRIFFTSTEFDLGDKLQNADGNYLDSEGQVISVSEDDATPATWDQIQSSNDLKGKLVPVLFNEGNPMEDSNVTTKRTVSNYKTGRQFRLGIRVNF